MRRAEICSAGGLASARGLAALASHLATPAGTHESGIGLVYISLFARLSQLFVKIRDLFVSIVNVTSYYQYPSAGPSLFSPAGWAALHAHPTPGYTFGMETFFTQGGVNHYQDGCLGPVPSSPTLHYGQVSRTESEDCLRNIVKTIIEKILSNRYGSVQELRSTFKQFYFCFLVVFCLWLVIKTLKGVVFLLVEFFLANFGVK